jgi:hypothetical protein
MHSTLHPSSSARNSARVNIYNVDDMTHWCEKFGCTKTQLRDAVTAVGTSADTLREYISRARDDARSEATHSHLANVSRLLQSSR